MGELGDEDWRIMMPTFCAAALRAQATSEMRAVRQSSPPDAWLTKQTPSDERPMPLPEPRTMNVPPLASAKEASLTFASPISLRFHSVGSAPASAGVANAGA